MAPQPRPEDFGFNASAVGFGGMITRKRGRAPLTGRPLPGFTSEPVRSVASVALAPSGGLDRTGSPDQPIHYEEHGISFDAFTEVEGTSRSDREFITRATVSLENVKIYDVLAVRSMTATLTSRRRFGAPHSRFDVKASIRGLALDGLLVENVPLDFDVLNEEAATYRDFVRFFSNKRNLDKYAKRFGWVDPTEEAILPASLTAGTEPRELNDADAEPVRCSLLSELLPLRSAMMKQEGYTLNLGPLGKIHLAEVLVKKSMRRVNLLRLELKTPRSAAQPRIATDDDEMTGVIAANQEGETTLRATNGSAETNGAQSYP